MECTLLMMGTGYYRDRTSARERTFRTNNFGDRTVGVVVWF